MSESYQQLQKLSDDAIIEIFDRGAKTTEFFPDYYLGILNRRQQDRQTKQIVRLTWVITILTAIVTFATIVNVGVFIYEVSR